MIPKRSFFTKSSEELAPLLLGARLIHRTPFGLLSGRIVETESYLGSGDPACHAARGKTKRTHPMFEKGGIAYVYLIYGMYHCFNIVTGPKDSGEAVLIRALEPLQGIERMKELRGGRREQELCSGPGKLCMALDIDLRHDGSLLVSPSATAKRGSAPGALSLEIGEALPSERIGRSGRIGISEGKDLLLRFFERENPHVSKLSPPSKKLSS